MSKETIERVEAEEVKTEETAVAVDDAKQKGAEIGNKIKAGVKKVWNSKPAKVVKTVGLIGIGVIGGLCLGKAASKDNSDGDFEVMDFNDDSISNVPDVDSNSTEG